MKKLYFYFVNVGDAPLVTFFLMQYKLKMLQFIPNAASTFLWAMSDAHSRMINSFESILFKGLIKPVGKPVNRFANQFEWFVQFPAARAESSEAVLTQSCNRKFKNIKSVENGALDLQSIERKSAKAIVCLLWRSLWDEYRVCCLRFHRYR